MAAELHLDTRQFSTERALPAFLRPDSQEELPGKSLKQTSENVIKTLKIVRENGPDADQARNLLGTLLTARESYYYNVVKTINPEISRVGDFLYKLGDGERPLYGSIVSLLDASPAIHSHAQLVEGLKLEIPGNNRSLMGEEVSPEYHFQSSVVVSGSSAERKTHPFAADLDLAEYINLKVHNKTHAGALIAKGIQNSAINPLQILYIEDQQNEAYLETVRVGKYGEKASTQDKSNRTIPWNLDEIRRGYKDAVDINGNPYKISLSEICQNPTGLRFEYLLINQDDVSKVEKVVFINAADSMDKTVINTLNNYTYAFDQVYFDDPTPYGLTSQIADAGSFITYTGEMLGQLERSGSSNAYVYCQRLYKLLKVVGDLSTAGQLIPFFEGPAARLHQLTGRFQATQKATLLGLADPASMDYLKSSMKDILRQDSIRPFLSEKDLKVVLDTSTISARRVKDVAFKIKTLQAADFLDGMESSLSPLLRGILPVKG